MYNLFNGRFELYSSKVYYERVEQMTYKIVFFDVDGTLINYEN